MFCYDNINISTSNFVEQRGSSTPAKVRSGTFGILYKLHNASPQDLALAPITSRFKDFKGLSSRDLCLSFEQVKILNHQFSVIVAQILCKYCKSFEKYARDPALQPIPRRQLPPGHKTQQYPLRATTIDESSIQGNLSVHENVYLVQLGLDTKTLSQNAIPSVNDQSTNARIRGGQVLRIHDVNPWARRDIFQIGFGLFHLCMNLIWALLHVHRGSLSQIGSLAYFFTLLEKTRLGADHPDYHTLLAALTQILHGIVLNGWQQELGDFEDFAKTSPTAQDLLHRAQNVLLKCTTPIETWRKGEKAKDPLIPPYPNALDPLKDLAHQNILLLTRDLLYVAELTQAISQGDFGRVEDLLLTLAKIFRGAGSNNYCTEILHFLANLKYIWTPEFR
jgi:hypothetical protein